MCGRRRRCCCSSTNSMGCCCCRCLCIGYQSPSIVSCRQASSSSYTGHNIIKFTRTETTTTDCQSLIVVGGTSRLAVLSVHRERPKYLWSLVANLNANRSNSRTASPFRRRCVERSSTTSSSSGCIRDSLNSVTVSSSVQCRVCSAVGEEHSLNRGCREHSPKSSA